MTDLVFVLALIGFFAVCAGFVMVCERIIGPDPEGVALSAGSAGSVDSDAIVEPDEVSA